ncbi:MAG: PfkB family carbohydrate kinase [Pseudomonadota bacterium]
MIRQDDSAPRAFVIGNVAVDEVLLLRALPAPGQSVHGRIGHTGLGGKGANQAIALARTGVATTLVAAVGADNHAERVASWVGDEGLTPAFLSRPDLATDRSIVLTGADGDNVIVTTNACAASLTTDECAPVLNEARRGEAVLLQGNLRPEVTAALSHACLQRGLRLVFNPSPFDAAFRDLLPNVDTLFVNAPEAESLTGHSDRRAVDALLHAGANRVVLTLGRDGALLGAPDGVLHVPAASANVIDVTGAGDCFLGIALGSALSRGTAVDETALHHARQAAAHTVERVGAAASFPSRAQVAALLSGQGAS